MFVDRRGESVSEFCISVQKLDANSAAVGQGSSRCPSLARQISEFEFVVRLRRFWHGSCSIGARSHVPEGTDAQTGGAVQNAGCYFAIADCGRRIGLSSVLQGNARNFSSSRAFDSAPIWRRWNSPNRRGKRSQWPDDYDNRRASQGG